MVLQEQMILLSAFVSETGEDTGIAGAVDPEAV